MKAKSKSIAKSFKATLERMEGNLGWVIVRLPFDVEKVWGVRGQLRVKGEINGFAFHGFAFRTTASPASRGHFMLVTKIMQAGGAVRTGHNAHFRLEPDLEVRKAIMPVELKRALSQVRSVQRWFDSLSRSMRAWFCSQVAQPKSAAARVRRAEQIAELLLSTMEAERELPPILKAAFARDPRAWEGWQRMTPTMRRHNLLSIFHYRRPESRERRIAKMLEEAVARAGSRSREIGIGETVTRPPLPHDRTCGSASGGSAG
jgi:uncharacterized protein YdeI (YjbR/CyaY-like superfamily)